MFNGSPAGEKTGTTACIHQSVTSPSGVRIDTVEICTGI